MMNNASTNHAEDTVCSLCQGPYVPPRNKLIRTTKDILSCVEHFRDKKQEYLICLSLDSAQRLIAQRIVTIGLLDSTLVHPREVFTGPLTDRAASIVIIHNHPSGIVEPSSDDIKTTQQLVAASLILKVQLKDHIILTEKGHFSFRGHRLM